jgi:preprotein translocase subunit SecD
MANPRRGSHSVRALLALLFIFAAVFGAVGATAHYQQGKKWTPELGLDLQGGTSIVLQPVVVGGGSVTAQTLEQSVDIIRARIDGSGVGEAEVATEGGRNVVVSVPGKIDQRQRNLIKQSSQLRFRAVLVATPAGFEPAPAPTGTATGQATPGATGTATPSAPATGQAPAPTATARQGSATTEPARRALPQALLNGATATPSPSAPASATPSAPAASSPAASSPATPGAPASTPPAANASDLAQITPALEKQFVELDCTDTSAIQGSRDDPKKPLVTCSDDRTEKYILGPAEVIGTDIKDATAGLQTTQQGAVTNTWVIQLSFNGEGTRKFRDVTARLTGLENPRNRFAVTLDGLVITAPTSNEVIPNGQAEISGDFTQASAQSLANQLKYGALPISFTTQTEDTISALLGAEQLQRGLLAGMIGLVLVVIYFVLQYRALAVVAIASLLVAAGLTYGAVVLLGQTQGLRLTLAGVTGLIVSIGITADSFIVYFERVRDEVREGRHLKAAVENGWRRARRTLLAADGINLLGAIVLFVLAAGNVRGFAYTLGLATIIDVVVTFLFTHPLLTLLARTKFFGQGHRLSGLDPERLGASAAVSLKANLGTIAGRRRAAANARTIPKEA